MNDILKGENVAQDSTKLTNLRKMADDIKNRIASKQIPSRRVGQEVPYNDYLKRELARTEKQIAQMVLDGVGAKK